MIGIADRERLGQRKLEGNVVARVVTHRVLGLEARPLAEFALIPCGLRVGEEVRRVRHQQRAAGFRVQVVGRNHLLTVRLKPHGLAALEWNREAIAETAHAAQRAEIVVEGPVLLHQDDDVPDVLNGPGRDLCFDGKRAADHRGQHGKGTRCAQDAG